MPNSSMYLPTMRMNEQESKFSFMTTLLEKSMNKTTIKKLSFSFFIL